MVVIWGSKPTPIKQDVNKQGNNQQTKQNKTKQGGEATKIEVELRSGIGSGCR